MWHKLRCRWSAKPDSKSKVKWVSRAHVWRLCGRAEALLTAVPWQLLYKGPPFAIILHKPRSHCHYRHKYGMAKHVFYALLLKLLFTGTLTRDPASEQLHNYRETHVSTAVSRIVGWIGIIVCVFVYTLWNKCLLSVKNFYAIEF